MKREEKLAVFAEQVGKTQEERDSIIQTGLYNSYIAGYLAFTLEDMGHSPENIQRALDTLREELETRIAQDARERGL